MADRVTIWRFYHRASRSLLGDGRKVEVVGWTVVESSAGVELDILGEEKNEVARVAYVFHTEGENPAALVASFKEGLGFVPELTEFESFLRSDIVPRGARDDWFDVFDGGCAPGEQIYVLFPGSDKNRDEFRSCTREILCL